MTDSKSKSGVYRCDPFKEAFNEGTIVPIYGNDYEYIETRIGTKLSIPKISGYSLILANKYDFHNGYGEERQISFCPFCGEKLV